MKCCICKKEIEPIRNEQGVIIYDQGNNADPVKKGRCCNICDQTIVIPTRMKMINQKMNREFWLIGKRTAKVKDNIKIIDRITSFNLRDAKQEFKIRNSYKRLLEKYNLTIAESKAYWEN